MLQKQAYDRALASWHFSVSSCLKQVFILDQEYDNIF